MDTTKILQTGQTYTFKVIELVEHADDFKPRISDAPIKYCHHLKLEDEAGDEFFAQICTDYKFYKDCQQGDWITARIKSLSKNKYTISDIVNKSIVTRESVREDWPASSRPDDKRVVDNPPMAGTAAAIALQCATNLCSQIETAPGEMPDYLEHADKMFEWLKFNS